MKKVLFGLVFALFAMQVNAAPLITINNSASAGGGTITNDSAPGAAIASHNDIAGGFNDIWDITVNPAAATLNVATSNPLFSSFNAAYSTDAGATWSAFANGSSGLFSETLWDNISQQLAFKVNVWGDTGATAASYDLRVSAVTSAVPLPAAVWLFGSALMGMVGVSKRKSTAIAA